MLARINGDRIRFILDVFLFEASGRSGRFCVARVGICGEGLGIGRFGVGTSVSVEFSYFVGLNFFVIVGGRELRVVFVCLRGIRFGI